MQNTVRTGMIVRRLTPMECERLQGFSDGWTDIGEWRDSKGKLRKPSDSPRYKALGNSIALPFWDFLAKRISAQYLRPVTMGSLFDGIGGFPLVFERHNGKGTARWASEIEEFPIAVTKNGLGRNDMTTLRMIPGITYTRQNLEALTGMPDRENRRMIRAQRRQGVPIVALKDGGYKLAETDEEKKMLLAMYRKRALDELDTYRRLAKSMQVDGQMEVAGDGTV